MPDQIIILTVKPDGSFEIEPQVHNGKACKKDTEGLEALLGTVTNTELKTEYFTETQTQQTQQFE